jgi:hypothetical protein
MAIGVVFCGVTMQSRVAHEGPEYAKMAVRAFGVASEWGFGHYVNAVDVALLSC